MTMNRILFVPVFLVLAALFTACEKEAALVASAPQEFYDFPQGNNAYEAEFEAFYQQYGSYVLYRFSDNDFRWNGTTRLLYMARQAEPAAIAPAFDFIKKACLQDYSEERLQTLLPFKILLSAGVHQLTANANRPTGYDTVATNLGVYSGLNQVTFGYANAQLGSLTASQKLDLQASLHRAFFTQALSRAKFEVPAAFAALFDATGNSATAYRSLGFLEFQRSYTATLDFLMFVYATLRYNQQDFTTRYLGSTLDPSGRTALKYALIRTYLSEEWGLAINEINNRAL